MEKRTFLAIILSLMVLLVWGQIFTPKPAQPPEIESTKAVDFESPLQEVENVDVVSRRDERVSRPTAREKITTISTDSLTTQFSSVGGSLHSATLNKYGFTFPLESTFTLGGYEAAAFKLISSGGEGVVFQYTEDGLVITKRYSFFDDPHTIKAEIEVENNNKTSKLIDFDVNAYTANTSSLDNKEMARERSLLEYSVDSESGLLRKTDAYKFSPKENKNQEGGVNWVGFRNRYYFFIVQPHFKADGYSVSQIDEHQLGIAFQANKVKIQPGSSIIFDSTIYAGPQELKLLKSYDQGIDKIMVFSRFGLFDGIAKIIYSLLFFIHKIVPNWGASIIIISLLIYGCTYPLTARGMANMRRMQALQPQMNELREKYKSNPQKMNQEMALFWKKHKINPFGGCVFMIMQFPIFIGLYQVLWRSVVFKGSGFLWIKDLSMPDRLMILPFSLPYIGNELNILPVLMMVAMFFQQKITSRSMVSTDPAQIMQQKMMGTVFPVFLGFIFYKFASGLALYFTMFYTLSIFTQLRMAKKVQVV